VEHGEGLENERSTLMTAVYPQVNSREKAAERRMELRSGTFVLSLANELASTSGSADNPHVYEREYDFTEGCRTSSRLGVRCRASNAVEHSCVLLSAAGATTVHEHSAVVVGERCFVAVGDRICALAVPGLELEWATTVDWATCFGVYYSSLHDCLLSHGELAIARISLSGAVVWSVGGPDIFSEGFRVDGDQVEAIDFDRRVFRLDIQTGQVRELGP
jgi:hypothetical protein